MNIAPKTYIRRHVLHRVNQTKGNLMQALADVADDKGVTRNYTQADAAHDLGLALITVKKNFAILLRPPAGAPGPFLEKLSGRRYLILGIASHSPATCDGDECHAEAEARRAAGGKLSDKKRAQAAARAREFRRRRREAAQQAAQQ